MILIIIIVVLILIFLILAYLSYKNIDINEYNISDTKIDKDIKIVLLSDLHNRNISDRLDKILNEINPDIILLSGDMVNGSIDKTKNFFNLISVLKRYKTYYCFGNHEDKMSEIDKIKYLELLSKTNIILLNNKSIKLSDNISLHGYNADISYFEGFRCKKYNIDDIIYELGKTDENKYNILIVHDPKGAYSYSKCKYDLTVSGHIHGGVIKVPFFGGLLSPDYKFFPKYFEGINKVNSMNLIVSRGLGFCEHLPFRILNPGEVVVINIMKKK